MGWILFPTLLLAVPILPAQAAPSDFPLKLRLVQPAGSSDSTLERVMLQMTVDGQQDQSGNEVRFYGSDGSLTGSFTIPAAVPIGLAARTILLAPAGTSPAPDFDLGAVDRLDPAGGGVCFVGAPEADCVTWGSFPGALLSGLPDPQLDSAGAIAASSALGRLIARDCPTWLGPDDDVDFGSADFAAGIVQPRNNATAPPASGPFTEVPCQLETGWNQTPANPTNDTTPTFAFGSVPRDYTAVFMCSFESAPFSACDPSGISYGPLADATYNFRVYAQNGAGPDPTPLSWTWEVDTVPPDTAITQTPPEPSSGFSASFSFASTEPHSAFVCQFESGPIQTCESPKTLFNLADGPHAFRVWAIDNATNKDPSAAQHVFNVDTTLGDVSPPETTLLSRPPKQTARPSAAFTYRSSEPRSSFQCRLDEAPFTPCEAPGITYQRLKNGPHVFRVRATDRAGNTDLIPASYTWSVAAPLPKTRITAAPPGAQRLRGRKARRSGKARVRFAFRSSKPGSSFRCRLDKQRFRPCRSPRKLRVKPGRHRFEVYAIDSLGNQEARPARRIFRVVGVARGLFSTSSSLSHTSHSPTTQSNPHQADR